MNVWVLIITVIISTQYSKRSFYILYKYYKYILFIMHKFYEKDVLKKAGDSITELPVFLNMRISDLWTTLCKIIDFSEKNIFHFSRKNIRFDIQYKILSEKLILLLFIKNELFSKKLGVEFPILASFEKKLYNTKNAWHLLPGIGLLEEMCPLLKSAIASRACVLVSLLFQTFNSNRHRIFIVAHWTKPPGLAVIIVCYLISWYFNKCVFLWGPFFHKIRMISKKVVIFRSNKACKKQKRTDKAETYTDQVWKAGWWFYRSTWCWGRQRLWSYSCACQIQKAGQWIYWGIKRRKQIMIISKSVCFEPGTQFPIFCFVH